MGPAERKFEAMVVDGASPADAAAACGLKPLRAARVSDAVALRDLGGLLARRREERVAEQHAALYAFYVGQREAYMRDISWAEGKRGEADQGDPALDAQALKWSREVDSLRQGLARVEERLRALGAMSTGAPPPGVAGP